MGQPISRSVKAGFKAGPALECFSPLPKLTRTRCEEGKGPGVQPLAIRMSQSSVQATAALRIPTCLPVWLRSVRKRIPSGPTMMQARLPLPLKVGVGQNEEPVAQVAGASFRRRLDARSNPIAQALKVSHDVSQTKGEMAGDVLEEAPLGCDLGDDAGDVGPEVPGVVGAAPVP